MAGLYCIRILRKSTAAVMNFGFHEQQEEKKVVVFHFGGGTLDVQVLQIDNGYISVDSTGGDPRLGGRDLDAKLVDHCLNEFRR